MVPFISPNKCKLKIIGLSNFFNNPLIKRCVEGGSKMIPSTKLRGKPPPPPE
jgi:hypothetical protein